MGTVDPSTVTRTASLTRGVGNGAQDGTLGQYASDSGFRCATVERPWDDNLADLSCVPVGRYLCLWTWSPKHNANVYELQDVPGRTAVEIHAANVFEQLLGCIAPGHAVAEFAAGLLPKGLPATAHLGVTESVATLAALEADMRDGDGNQAPFWLVIQ
jgi:hypothetical protein